MKSNQETLYAKALAAVLSEKLTALQEKVVLENFIKLLEGKGYQRKAKKIVELAEVILLQKQGKRRIIIQTARKVTSKQKEMIEGFVKKGDLVQAEIKPELIGGVKVIIDGSKQFDFSMKSKLDKLFL